MSALDRELAREVATGIARGDYDTADNAVDALEDCVRPFVWRDLEQLLAEHYPEDIFPVLPDDAARDLGPRLLSLARLLHRAEAKLAQVEGLCQSAAREAEAYPHDEEALVFDAALDGVREILGGRTHERQDLTGQ